MKRAEALDRVIIGASLAALMTVVHADNMTTLPPVVAVATHTGGQVVCYGYDCAGIVVQMAPAVPLFHDVILADAPSIDHEQFCAALKAAKPSPSCSASNPPSTAGTDPNWQPNGCGSSSADRLAIAAAILVLAPDEYAGNVDAPYQGVSFLNACNAHDACWSRGFDKYGCDETFQENMTGACSVVSDMGGRNVCNGMANIYSGFVSATQSGIDNYNAAVSEHRCAMWAKDMNANSCPQ